MLFSGQLAPLTFASGFLESSAQAVSDALETWSAEFTSSPTSKRITGDLRSLLGHLEPLTIPPTRQIVITTDSSWSALFDNGAQGGEPANIVGVLAQRLRCRGITVTYVSQQMHRLFGAALFNLFGPEETHWLNYVRSVGVLNDGRWRFVDEGSLQAFERPERYRARHIRDRCDAALLAEYAAHFGIRLFDEDFYGPQGFLVEIPRPVRVGPLSLLDAQQRLQP